MDLRLKESRTSGSNMCGMKKYRGKSWQKQTTRPRNVRSKYIVIDGVGLFSLIGHPNLTWHANSWFDWGLPMFLGLGLSLDLRSCLWHIYDKFHLSHRLSTIEYLRNFNYSKIFSFFPTFIYGSSFFNCTGALLSGVGWNKNYFKERMKYMWIMMLFYF